MAQVQWRDEQQHFASIIGQLTRDTVPELWKTLQSWQPSSEHFEVNLKQLDRVDSAGMVMLIHLLEHAKTQNCHIMLTFMPDQLKTLFKLSNIDEIFLDHIQTSEI